MEQATQGLAAILAKESWVADDIREFQRQLSATPNALAKVRTALNQLLAENPQPTGGVAVKAGVLQYMLCRASDALATLAKGTDNKERHFYQAAALQALGQYVKSAEEFAKAKDRGWDAAQADARAAESLALAGQLDQAKKLSNSLPKDSADALYIRGLIDDVAGLRDQAAESYEKARAIDPNHIGATFRLAYYYDCYSDEHQAIELYRQLVSQPIIAVNALVNLAILYEDSQRYDQASACLRRILAINPNHKRAGLFFKDVEASRSMYFDEDQAKVIARRNAVLDIPVTDFELSVRARNCLKKMNIRTLGDLVRTSEATLLSYKNFGETSLKEIKDMLSMKNLRLGQALEEGGEDMLPRSSEIPLLSMPAESAAPAPAEQGARGIALAQLEFSVRARRALESLNIRTLGELADRSENELLQQKNFGQTSLSEVRERLSEHGLSLREG